MRRTSVLQSVRAAAKLIADVRARSLPVRLTPDHAGARWLPDGFQIMVRCPSRL